jgi:hypothetical protein
MQTVQVDSFSFIPNSVHIPAFPDSIFQVDEVNGRITGFRNAYGFCPDPLPVFPGRLNSSTRGMVYDSIMNNFLGKPYVPDFGQSADQRFFEFGNINYNGSFGRGISLETARMQW